LKNNERVNMYDDAITLEELLQQQKLFNARIAFVTTLLVATLAGGLMQDLQFLILSVIVFCFSIYLIMAQRSKNDKINEILQRMDFSLLQFEDSKTRTIVERKLTKLFGNIPQRITSNSEMTRMRGADEKGPTWGKQDGVFGEVTNFRDAVEHGKVFDGLEGDLYKSEKLIRNANENYSEMAQQRWEKSQSNDQDLVEAGVETLAELVTTDYFEKNSKDGAVEELVGQNSD
jgi:hypothetical protein